MDFHSCVTVFTRGYRGSQFIAPMAPMASNGIPWHSKAPVPGHTGLNQEVWVRHIAHLPKPALKKSLGIKHSWLWKMTQLKISTVH